MKKLVKSISALSLAALFLGGCIENDVPYPKIVSEITAFEVAGQVSQPNINNSANRVEVVLADTVDLRHVQLVNLEVSNEATVAPKLDACIDLSSPLVLTLTTYQDYNWTIVASQVFNRKIQVDGQVGKAVFDEFNRIVLVYVSEDTDLNDITVTQMQLGPQGASISPDFTQVKDFFTSRKFTWTYKQRSEDWTVKIVKTQNSVITGKVNAFARYAFAEGEFMPGSGTPKFLYKPENGSQWQELDQVEVNGGAFKACIEGLEPSTVYMVKAAAGENEGLPVTFTTEAAAQVPNSSFDQWYKDDRTWYPDQDLSPENKWWDTGNKGTNLLSEKNPTTEEKEFVVKGSAAKLACTSVVGVFAAGSIYTGNFNKVVGVGAELSFGIPFTSRPKGFRGHFSYAPGIVDKAKAPYQEMKGAVDTCHIYAILADWDQAHEINTTTGKFIDRKNDRHIIAMCEIQAHEATGGYREFNLDFEYRDMNRKPKFIAIVVSASKYGDYFTGSTSTVMYVDEFELVY